MTTDTTVTTGLTTDASADTDTHATATPGSGSGTTPSAGTLLPVSTRREAATLARSLLATRRGPMVLCVLAFLLDGLAGLVAPWMLGRIVDVVGAVAAGTAGEAGASGEVVRAGAWILGAALVGAAAISASYALLARAAEPALADLRERALDRALHLDSAELERAGAGDLLSRVGDDVRLVAASITSVVPLMVNSVIAIVFTAAGLFALDWRLGLAGLGAIPFYVLGLRWYLPRSGPYYQRERAANGERAEAFVTGVHASRTLRAFGLAEDHQRRVDATSWDSARISIDVYRLLTRFFARTNRAELIGLLLILVTGFLLVRGEETTVGAVTAAALFFHRLFNPIGAVMALFDEVQSAGASLTRLAGIALLPDRPAADVVRRSGRGGDGAGSLVLRGLGHAYAEGRPVLADVHLELVPGERVAVVGATGAGKSTLGAAVAGRLRPSAGEVLVDGRPVEHTGSGSPTVALVSQEVHVFAGTVRDNLTLAAPGADDAEVAAALRAVGAWGWVAALPEGLDTLVGDGTPTLTPARAQQLALARVVLADPLVVVLDEATAEAGSAGARDLETAALAVTQGRTSLTIAHRLTQAASADRVLVLDRGRVVELGPHTELVAAGGTYAALWDAWSGGSGTPPT